MVAQWRTSPDNDRRAYGLRRRGFSLIELVAVLALIGVLVGVSIRYLPDRMGNLTVKVDARRMTLDLVHCRRAAIATGDNHLLVFNYSGKRLSGYTPSRRTAGGAIVAIDRPRLFSSEVKVDLSGGDPEFSFEGTALTYYEVTLAATNRVSVVTVTPTTGSVEVADK